MLRSETSQSGKSLTASGDKSPAAGKIADTRFRKLIENSNDGLTLLNKDLQIIYRSASAERINGWNEAERIKYTLNDLVHPDDQAQVKSLFEEVLLSPGVPKNCNFRSRHFDGHYIWLECVYTNFLNDPDINAIVCNFRDITDRKLTEERVIESEHFTKTITDNLPAMIAYWSANLSCLFANKPYMQWFEKRPDEILGINKRDLLEKEEFKLHELHIQNVLKGVPQRFERTFRRLDGRTIYADTQYLPDKEGKIIKGFYSLIYDVTALKQAEVEVIKKNEQIESILESLTDGFISLDQNRCYTYANKQVGLMLGRDPASLTGKNIWDVFPDAVGSATYDAIETAFKENKYVCNEDHYEPLGLWQENRVYPSGNGISMFIRDISERKNEELRKSLLSDISLFFNQEVELNRTLQMVLGRMLEFTNFSMAEAWLIGVDKNKIQLSAKFPGTAAMQIFYDASVEIKSFVKGRGLPGIVWETQTVKFWSDVDKNKQFIRRAAAKKAGLKTVCGIPLKHNNEVIGVLMLGSTQTAEKLADMDKLVETVGDYLGAEIKRKQLEQELNQIFNFAPDIICIAGVDGYFKKVNPALCTLLEYSEEELLAMPYLKLVHPDDRQPTVTEVGNVFDGKPSMNFENRYITKSGKIKVLSWTATGASDDSLLFCVAKDVTEKKELEDLFNKATALAHIGSWEMDVVKNTVYWSEIARQIHEAEPGYHPNMEAAVNFYKKGINREIIVKTMESAINVGTPGDVELQIVTAKGNLRWVRIIVEAEFADGKCLRVYGSIQDIDVRKKAEIAGKQALEERNTILESIDDAFFAVDKHWKVTYWNNRAEKVLMVPRNKILNKNLWKVFSESIGSESYKKYHESLETNQAVHFEDYFEPLNRWYEISAYPSVKGLSVYFKDITDRRLSETLLRELNSNLKKQAKELAISNAELEQFAYVASHDLQEPLRMVTSFMTQLEKKYGDVVDDKGRQYIHFAVDGAKRMRQIILDLLDFSRVGRTEDDLEDVDFNKLLNEILALYRRQIEELDAKISFENLPVVQTYKTPIRQVLQNLVSNGLKYQKAGVSAVITISCKETKTHYQFSVKDNGIGIAPEYFEKIFIIFQRLHNKDEYSGTGMGLAIAKKIIENLGGKIWVESKEGKGSVFYFTLLKKTSYERD